MADNELTTLGVANINITHAKLRSVREGWVNILLPTAVKGKGRWFSIFDNRPEVVAIAEEATAKQAEINAVKRRRTTSGKSRKELEDELNAILSQFQTAFHQPAIISVRDLTEIWGNFRTQEMILNDPQGNEATLTVFSIRTQGVIWHREPFRTPFQAVSADRNRQRMLHLVVASENEPTIVFEINPDTIKQFSGTHNAENVIIKIFKAQAKEITETDGGVAIGSEEEFVQPVDETAPPIENQPAAVMAPPAPETTRTICPECKKELDVPNAYYTNGGTVRCPLCGSMFRAIDGRTLLASKGAVTILKLIAPEAEYLAEISIQTIEELAGKTPAEIKKTKVIKLTRAQELVAAALELMGE